MILRKALLISAPAGARQHSSGVNADLEATRQFLLSPNGGAWIDEEIIVLHNPTVKMISKAVQEMEADYTITFFSGKGFPDKQGNHFLLASDNDFFQDTELLNKSPKQVVIVDGCREFIEAGNENASVQATEFANARKMYDKWILSCEPGQMIMHATEQSTVSSASYRGGIFTQKLLQVASSITPAKDKFKLKSILAAGHETPDLLLEEGFEEGPAITYSNGNIKLPFAMALPAPISLLPAIKKDDFASGLSLGLFFLAFLLSLE
jgi:hypothetical protein